MYDPEIHRQDFEQHFSQYDGFCAERCPETGEYLLAHIESHWATWLAARTTIVVKEPAPIVFERLPLMQGGYDAGVREYERVLSALGIKVEKYNA